MRPHTMMDIAEIAGATEPLPHGLPPADARRLLAIAQDLDDYGAEIVLLNGAALLGDANRLHWTAAQLRDRAAGLRRRATT